MGNAASVKPALQVIRMTTHEPLGVETRGSWFSCESPDEAWIHCPQMFQAKGRAAHTLLTGCPPPK